MLKLFRRQAGGNFYMRGTVQGHRIYESTGTGNRPAAEAIKTRRESGILARAAHGKAATLTFAEAALTYMESGGETRHMARILHHFGPDTLLADIDNAALQRAARLLYPAAAPATINRQLITPVSAVVTMAANEGLTTPRRFRRQKGDTTRTRWLDPAEAEALLANAAPHILPILAVLIGTGCRTGEALTIQAQFFYPATGEIWLPDTKNGHPRMLQLPRRARDIISAAGLPDRGPLFLTPKGKPYVVAGDHGGQIKGAFDKARAAAGLGRDVTPHTLRHTWATWYYAATRDFGGLLDLGGWRKADMAMRYRKIAPADLAARLAAHQWEFSAPAGTGPTLAAISQARAAK